MNSTAPGPRVKLLVSVRNVAEARDAAGGGVDIIDIKEPSRGPLGRADAAVIKAIGVAIGAGRVSVALGELAEFAAGADITLPASVTYAKMGLLKAPDLWRRDLADAFTNWAHVRPVAVAYADKVATPDHPGLDAVVGWAIENRAAGVLIDTTVKDGRNLFDFMDEETIAGLRAKTRDAGLFLALAGSLRGDSFQRAVGLEPDIVAVRGAACLSNQRQQSIDPSRIRALLDVIEAHHSRTRQGPANGG